MKRMYFWLVFTLMVSVLSVNTYGADEQQEKHMKPVLLVIDIQNQYLTYVPEHEKKIALEMINGAIWLFRQHGFPVIRVYNTDPEWGPEPDTEAFEFPSSVDIKPDDPKIIKNYPNAFNKTDLEKRLRDDGCNTVFLCGLSAVGCVLATYHGAMDRDFNVVMIKDALMSHDSTYTNFIEEIFDTVSLSTLQFMLKYAQE